MNLSEKIYYCRKKSGRSQEALAEAIGVSRQAISKWETGEAEPEARKLKLLADAFQVSVDWLLSDDPVPEENKEPATAASWVDSLPGVVGRLLRRYGWLAGVYAALSGGGIALIGFLARTISRAMFRSFDSFAASSFPEGTMYQVFDAAGNPMNPADFGLFSSGPAADFATSNPVYLLGTAMLGVGLLVMLAGIILAVVLKKQSGDHLDNSSRNG